jgi:hypothetical protein
MKLYDLSLSDELTLAGHDYGFDRFAPLFIRHGDYGALQHAGMLIDDFFDLTGRDIQSAADDEVTFAIGDIDIPAVVGARHVPGVQPTIAQDEGGGIGRAPVAAHHGVTAHGDFPHLTRRHRGAVVIDETHVHRIGWSAARGEQVALPTADSVYMVFAREHRHHG